MTAPTTCTAAPVGSTQAPVLRRDRCGRQQRGVRPRFVRLRGRLSGELIATVRYRLTEDDVLEVTMSAVSRAPTIAGMVHHSYWNLAGHDAGSVRSQYLWLGADFYTPLDETLIPTGAVVPVKGTPYDYTGEKTIGEGLDATGGIGFDNNFCLRGVPAAMRPVAGMFDPASGRRPRCLVEPARYAGLFGGPLSGRRHSRQEVCPLRQVLRNRLRNTDFSQFAERFLLPVGAARAGPALRESGALSLFGAIAAAGSPVARQAPRRAEPERCRPRRGRDI